MTPLIALSDLKRGIGLVVSVAPGLTVCQSLVVLFQAVLPLAGLYLTKSIVDAVVAPETAVLPVGVLLTAAALVALATVCIRETGGVLQERQSHRLGDRVFNLLHRQAAGVNLACLEQPEYHDAFHQALSEGPYRPARILGGLFDVLRNGVLLAGMTGFLFLFQWEVAALLPAAVLFPAIVRWRYARRQFDLRKKTTGTERRAGYYHWLLTSPEAAREVRLLDLFSFLSGRFNRYRQTVCRQRMALAGRQAVATTLMRAVGIAITFGCFALMARNAMSGTASVGEFVMLMQAFHRGAGALDGIFSGAAELHENRLFLSALFRFLDLPGESPDAPGPTDVPDLSRSTIAFENVSFTYPGTRRPVLQKVSFTLCPGDIVAIVGPNGAGKSTLIKLLCRLYEPDAGRILVDGRNIRHFDLKTWRRQIGVVFQDYIHYHFTVADNIRVGDIRLDEKDPRIAEAARHTGANLVSNALPHGIHTLLGRTFEGGCDLSEGQWQKIALARALVKDAGLMVLDEPTSALDADTEHHIFTRFRELTAKRSTLLISHRFSTVRMADRILVLQNARILEAGNHNELIRMRGRYSEMYSKQAGMYI